MNLLSIPTRKIARDPNFLGIVTCYDIVGGKRFCEAYHECMWIDDEPLSISRFLPKPAAERTSTISSSTVCASANDDCHKHNTLHGELKTFEFRTFRLECYVR